MKKIILSLLMAGLAGLAVSASAQNTPDQNNNNNAAATADQPAAPPDDGSVTNAADAGGPPPMMPPDAAVAADAANNGAPEDNQVKEPLVITPSQGQAAPPADLQSNFMPPAQAGTNANELRLNFRNAPLEMVLNYLSDAAGFIIVLDTQVRGNVSVISSHPMTKNEAVDLLNAVLNKNGYAAIRDGRTLTIVDKNDAKTRDIPVKSGNKPEDIPKNAEIVTQIIPIRFVEARQLMSDLSSFVSPQATVVANEAGNSIVITDTQSNIRHLAEIIRAIDNSAEAETEIRVFHLKYASPTDVAAEIGSIFPSSSSGSGGQLPTRFAGGGPGGGGGGGGGGRGGFGGGGNPFAALFGGGTTASSSQQRIQKATQVTAVADARIQAVIVTAPKDLIEEIAGMMTDLDVPSTRDQKVFVFHMNNGDPQQAAQVLQNMFQSSSSSRSSSSSSQNSALMQRAQNNATTTGSSSSSSTGLGGSSGGGRAGVGTQF
jgi:type II secretory pathway component GspD/PulD (secretin)